MKVLFLRDLDWSSDGIKIEKYKKGQEVEISEKDAKQILSLKYAQEVINENIDISDDKKQEQKEKVVDNKPKKKQRKSKKQ